MTLVLIFALVVFGSLFWSFDAINVVVLWSLTTTTLWYKTFNIMALMEIKQRHNIVGAIN
jgi:hypothetical protein